MRQKQKKIPDSEIQESENPEHEGSRPDKYEPKTIPINQNKFNLAEQYISAKYEFRVNIVALIG